MTLSGTRKRTAEIRISIIRKAGKICANLLAAIFTALSVFSRLEIKEISTASPVIMYK